MSQVLDDAVAQAALKGYLRFCTREQVDPEDATATRAYFEAWRQGARWALLTSGRLANPEFREAIEVIRLLLQEANDL